MDRHNRFDSTVEITSLETFFQIYRDQSGLPVVAVNNVRSEIDHRKNRQCRFGEECKFFQISRHAVVWFVPTEMFFVIDKIELDSFIFQLEDSYVLLSPVQIHVEIGYVV